jgi:hypothetical protein
VEKRRFSAALAIARLPDSPNLPVPSTLPHGWRAGGTPQRLKILHMISHLPRPNSFRIFKRTQLNGGLTTTCDPILKAAIN